MNLPKISHSEFSRFLRSFYCGEYPHLRLGQAFFNEYIKRNEFEKDNIFYETRVDRVMETIYSYYIE